LVTGLIWSGTGLVNPVIDLINPVTDGVWSDTE
jgi:hypothetical protein